ncbi:MAG: hypothetical protein JW742_09035 [Candidatus Aminicenantes bacterium]|nr:hypothetical protein [Candidatus Aminicenantes bacterium]
MEKRHPFFAFALFVLAAGAAFAHQPRLVNDRPSIIVRDPEISQAFYARLAGNPQTYYIRSDAPLRLYVNLLVPDLPGIETDYEAAVFRETGGKEELLARLDGRIYAWRPFFEPFGGDRYLLGPEYDEPVPAGAYTVVVTSPDNTGKYVLAVGKIEKFPPGEIARTIVALPKLKRYFDKSPWTAFFNLSGVFLLVTIGAVAGLAALLGS